jgi:hypothetical protein
MTRWYWFLEGKNGSPQQRDRMHHADSERQKHTVTSTNAKDVPGGNTKAGAAGQADTQRTLPHPSAPGAGREEEAELPPRTRV